ncbi:MAG: PRC-barrel domain-containing protein [Thermoplasmatota archaeon]
MLMELLEEYKVVNTVGEHVGKIKDAYLDLGKWEIAGFMVHPGAFKKSIFIDLKDMDRLDMENKTLVVRDNYDAGEIPNTPTKGFYPVEELMDLKVLDADGSKVGKIYNMEIPYEKLQKFKVWKVLIKTGIKEKRLRLSPSEIREVMQEIHLKKKEQEYVEQNE